MKVLRRCLFVIIPILALLTFYLLYAYGVIFKYEPNAAFRNAAAKIKIYENETFMGSYYIGYFVAPDMIAVNGYLGKTDNISECMDGYGNVYHIKERKNIGRTDVLITEEKNENSICYQYLPLKTDTKIITSLRSSVFGEFDVWDRRAIYYDKWFILGKGTLGDDSSSMPVVTTTGRIIGLTEKGGDGSFYVYTHYEIMKEIITHNIKEMLGIV